MDKLFKEFDLTEILKNLEFRNGIWYSKTRSQISYPDRGNELYFEIEENSFWFKHRNACILECVRNFSPKCVFFDIGGGNGYVCWALEQHGIKTVLLEPGEEGILNAQKRGLKNLVCSKIEDTNFQKKSISALGIFDVLEHIQDDKSFLLTLREYMTEEGRIYLTGPAYQFLWSAEDDYAGHIRRYSLRRLYQLLKSSGFIIEYSTYIFSMLPVPIFLFRTLPSRLRFRRDQSFKKYLSEHQHGGVMSGILDKIFNVERSMIHRKKRILFGGSCLVVGKIHPE